MLLERHRERALTPIPHRQRDLDKLHPPKLLVLEQSLCQRDPMPGDVRLRAHAHVVGKTSGDVVVEETTALLDLFNLQIQVEEVFPELDHERAHVYRPVILRRRQALTVRFYLLLDDVVDLWGGGVAWRSRIGCRA